MAERTQAILIWWALGFMLIFGTSMWTLLGMVPTPPAAWTPDQVAAFYLDHATRIKFGAMIASWTSAFMVPFSVVISVQMARLEKGRPVWSILAFAGGILMSIFLVLPPLFWGVAAFSPARLPAATALMNDLANLTLTTTDQFFIFQMVPMGVVSLTQAVDRRSALPRWLGWFTLWAALVFEVGALAFFFKSGPFAWNGLFVFWAPFSVFGCWVTTTSIVVLRALPHQTGELERSRLADSAPAATEACGAV
jgi:hypothetical protein